MQPPNPYSQAEGLSLRERLQGLMAFRVILVTVLLGGTIAVDVETLASRAKNKAEGSARQATQKAGREGRRATSRHLRAFGRAASLYAARRPAYPRREHDPRRGRGSPRGQDMPDLLIELFSEEIPARMQAGAAEDLKRLVTDGLVEAGLTYAAAGAYATPRRLALTVEGVTGESPTVTEERRGPQVSRAFRAPAAARPCQQVGASRESRGSACCRQGNSEGTPP